MARRKRTETETAPAPTPVALRIALEVTPDTPTYYINYAEVSFNNTEFALSGVRVPTRPAASVVEAAQKGSAIPVSADVQLIIPINIVSGLIRALNTTKDQFEQTVGPIKEPGVTG